MGNNESKYFDLDWVPDEEVTHCTLCSEEFTTTFPKHHCRFCGNVFCGDCCPQDDNMRVCHTCSPTRTELCTTVNALLEERFNLLTSTAPASFLTASTVQSCISMKELTKGLWQLPSKKAHFLADLIVAATRVWECFKKKDDGTPCFPGISSATLQQMLQEDTARVTFAFTQDFVFTSLTHENIVVQEAFQAIRNNIAVIRQIEPSVDLPELNQFLSTLQLVTFSPPINIYGLSSFKGNRIYIWRTLLEYPGETTQGKVTIEHEICHALPRWVATASGTNNPRLISPEKNPNLRSKRNSLIEAGDFYEQEVYKREAPGSPFCLVTPSWRGYY